MVFKPAEKTEDERAREASKVIPQPVEQVSRLAGLRPSRVEVEVKNVVKDLATVGLTPKEASSKAVCNSAFTGLFENMDPATQRFTKGLELYSIINQTQV